YDRRVDTHSFPTRRSSDLTAAVRCYYHGKWMDPSIVDFGAKANSASGLNSMCKDGMSKWTKQQRVAKSAKEALLTAVASGEVPADRKSTRLNSSHVTISYA